MIPTIPNIIKMLLAGECTAEQAEAWIEQHIKSAREAGPAPLVVTCWKCNHQFSGDGTYECAIEGCGMFVDRDGQPI